MPRFIPQVLAFAAIFLLTGTCGYAATEPPPKPERLAGSATLTLNELVRLVLQHNPTIHAARSSREAAAAAVTTAAARPNPRLEAAWGRNGARLPGVSSGSVGSWGVAQWVENPNLRSARVAAASFGQTASLHGITVSTHDLVAQTRVRGFEHMLRKDEARAAGDALQLLEQIQARVKVRVASGEAARYEIIKADAEVINARQKLQTAELQVEQSVLALNRLAGGHLPARWVMSDTLYDMLETPSMTHLQQSAMQHNPELKALQAEVDRRAARVREVQAERWPGLELRYGQVRDPEVRQNLLTVSVPIPLLDQRAGPVREATAELQRAQTLLEGRRAELAQQLQQAWKSLEIARVRVNALSSGAVREAEAALRVAEAAYRFGERGILDVLDAQRLLRQVNADLLDARFQVRAAGVELDHLAGFGLDGLLPETHSLP